MDKYKITAAAEPVGLVGNQHVCRTVGRGQEACGALVFHKPTG